MLQIWLLINLVIAQQVLIKNLTLQRDQDENIVSIGFDTDFLSNIQFSYLYIYGVNMHVQNNNEVQLKINQINGSKQYSTQAINIEYDNQFEYFFHLNFEAKIQQQYRIEMFSNQIIREFKEIVVIKITQSLDKNSLIYAQFFGDWKGIRNNISNVSTIMADGFIYQNYNNLKIMQNNINVLKAFAWINQTYEGLEIIFKFNQETLDSSSQNNYQQAKNLNNCWTNLVNYYCNNNYNNISLTINQQIKQNSLIELNLEFETIELFKFKSINTSIINMKSNQPLYNFYIESPMLNNFYLNEFNKLKQNRILQQFYYQIPSQILDFLNSQNETFCEKRVKNDTQCNNISDYINPQNFSLNQTILYNNTNKSLNFEDQLLISKKDSIKTITLNMTGVPDGQIMWYEVQINNTNTSNQSLDGIITTYNQLQSYQSINSQNIQNVNQTVSWNGSFIFQSISGLYQSSYVVDGEQILNYSQNNFTSCLGLGASVVGNYSNILTSICNIKDSSYIIYSTIPQTNYSQLINGSNMNNSIQLITNFSQLKYSKSDLKDTKQVYVSAFFDDIKKVFQIQKYVFILGRTNLSQFFEIHVFDINYNNTGYTNEIETISCFNTTKPKDNNDNRIHYSNITDFNITILQNKSITFNSTYSSRGVIFYICEQPNSLRYRGFDFVNTFDIQFHKISTKFNTNITCCLHYQNVSLNQVFIYTVIFDQLIIFITSDSSYSMAFMMSFTPLIDEREILQIEEVVAIIPPYGNWIQSAKAVLNNAYLVLVFKESLNSQNYSFAIYNLTKFNKQIFNQSNTLGKHNFTYMIAGTNSYKINGTIDQIVIVNQSLNDGAIIMGIIKNDNTSNNTNLTSIFTFLFNPNLTIQIDFSKFNSSNDYALVGKNLFQNTSALLHIVPPQSNKEYIIILSSSLILLIAVCSYLVILFKRKVREIECRFQQLNENKEIELK